MSMVVCLQARYIVLETRKDGTKFSNKELQAAASRLQQLSSSYDKLQDSLVQQVLNNICPSKKTQIHDFIPRDGCCEPEDTRKIRKSRHHLLNLENALPIVETS